MKNIIYILILILGFSCKKEKMKKPENFIPKEKMVALLVDMKIANKTKTIKTINLKKDLNYMSYIFEKYKIDSVQFKENNAYYVNHIVEYEDIYKEVQRRIKDSLAKYEKIVKTTDSIAREKRKLNKGLKKVQKELEIRPELMADEQTVKKQVSPRKSSNK